MVREDHPNVASAGKAFTCRPDIRTRCRRPIPNRHRESPGPRREDRWSRPSRDRTPGASTSDLALVRVLTHFMWKQGVNRSSTYSCGWKFAGDQSLQHVRLGENVRSFSGDPRRLRKSRFGGPARALPPLARRWRASRLDAPTLPVGRNRHPGTYQPERALRLLTFCARRSPPALLRAGFPGWRPCRTMRPRHRLRRTSSAGPPAGPSAPL